MCTLHLCFIGYIVNSIDQGAISLSRWLPATEIQLAEPEVMWERELRFILRNALL